MFVRLINPLFSSFLSLVSSHSIISLHWPLCRTCHSAARGIISHRWVWWCSLFCNRATTNSNPWHLYLILRLEPRISSLKVFSLGHCRWQPTCTRPLPDISIQLAPCFSGYPCVCCGAYLCQTTAITYTHIYLSQVESSLNILVPWHSPCVNILSNCLCHRGCQHRLCP